MILGFILMEKGGTPLVKWQLGSTISEKEDFISPLLSVLRGLSSAVMGEEVKQIETEGGRMIYCERKNDITAVALADEENEEILYLIEDILSMIKAEEITGEKLQFNPDIQEEIRNKIKARILKRPPSLKPIRDIADKISGLRTPEEGIPIRSPEPRSEKLEKTSTLAKTFGGKPTIEELFENYLEGKWEDVCEWAPILFDSSEADLARMLYVRSGINLNRLDPSASAPPLEKLSTEISQIDEFLARGYLQRDLNAQTIIGEYTSPRVFFSRRKNDFLTRLREDGIKSDIFASILRGSPEPEGRKILKEKFKRRSPLLVAQFKANEVILEGFSSPPKLKEDLEEYLSNSYLKFEEHMKETTLIHHLFLSLSHLLKGLLLPNLGVEEGKDLLNRLITLEKEQRGSVEKLLVGNYLKAFFFAISLAIGFEILLPVQKPEKTKEIDREYQKVVKNHLEWLQTMRNAERICPDMYIFAFTMLLSFSSHLLYENEEYLANVPKKIKNLANETMRKFWRRNKHLFSFYYSALLSTLGNTLIAYPSKKLPQSSILLEIASKIEKMGYLVEDLPLNRWICMIQALRFYKASSEKKGEKKFNTISERLKEKASPFFGFFVNNISEEDNEK